MLDTNSKRIKMSQQTNLRISKGIVLPGGTNVRVYMDVDNLFKNTTIYSVYPRTGSYTDPGDDLEDPQVDYVYPEVAYVYGLAARNPANYNNYRGVTLGVSFNF